MTWERIGALPKSYLELDQHGNVRRRSADTGRFMEGDYLPPFGRLGFGQTVRLDTFVQ